MGIIERFSTIMKSNVNALLDKAEDPEKMVNQILADLRENLADVKVHTAEVMANEKSCARDCDECRAKISKMESAAKNALKAGNEADARTLLEEKGRLTDQLSNLEAALEAAKNQSSQMRQMYDKLVSDIDSMEKRKAAIQAKMSVAKAQKGIAQARESYGKTSGSMEAFERMEKKADQMLDTSSAMLDLGESKNDADALADAYGGTSSSADVDAEIAKMKEELGL